MNVIEHLEFAYSSKSLLAFVISGHLIHRFNITESDWHRIKQNIDSKCRTAFRRKQRGMPLTVKAFRGKATPTYVQMNPADSSLSDEDSMQDSELHINVRTSLAYLSVCFGIPSLGFDVFLLVKQY